MKQVFARSVWVSAALALSVSSFAGCGTEGTNATDPKKLQVTSIAPACARPGETAYIEGKGFGAKNVTIIVGEVEAEVLSASGRTVSFVVPGLIPQGPFEVAVIKSGGKIATIDWVACTDGATVTFDVTLR
jgi:hypothetical protein